jgi:hypothetical protein
MDRAQSIATMLAGHGVPRAKLLTLQETDLRDSPAAALP